MCSLSLTLHKFENNNNRNISIYNLKKNTAIVINNGTTAYVFTDTDSLRNSEEYSFHLKNDFIKNGIKDAQYINIKTQKEFTPITSFYYRYPFLFYNGTTLYFLDKETRNDSVPNAEIINYVILTQDPFLKIDSTSNPFTNATYIIDNTNSWKSNNYWIKQFGKMEIPVYSVKTEGCYSCLLYTSDAADERSSVDLGGRRIIKKKNKEKGNNVPNGLINDIYTDASSP